MDRRPTLGPSVYWHSSERMGEVADDSVQLMVGASVYLGKRAPWAEYLALYRKVYVEEGLRVLRSSGYLVVIQTDAYIDGQVFPRNVYLPQALLPHYRLIDVKIWKRREADFFQVPFSQVFVFARHPATRRPSVKRSREYFQGVWEFSQTSGGALNGWPDGLCRMLIEAFSDEGDLIIDPFAGTGRLLGVAARFGRRAIGYEIDESLRPTVERNVGVSAEGFWT